MTTDDVQARLTQIREVAEIDDEHAHVLQDELYGDVLTAIAHMDCADPRSLAEAALDVRDIEFSRWYA